MTQSIDRLTYDKEADAAYVRFVQTDPEERLTTVELKNKQSIKLDFDPQDQLVGVEILHASDHLPDRLIDRAERIDQREDTSLEEL